jgi:hypothetical protein
MYRMQLLGDRARPLKQTFSAKECEQSARDGDQIESAVGGKALVFCKQYEKDEVFRQIETGGE